MIRLTEQDLKYIVKECVIKLNEEIAYHGSDAEFNNFDLDFVNTGAKAQIWGYGVYLSKSKKLTSHYGEKQYTVDIPSDNGNNYIHANEEIGSRLSQEAQKELFDYFLETEPESYPNPISQKELKNELKCLSPYIDGIDLYGTIMSYMGSDKEAALFCYKNLKKLGVRYYDNDDECIVMFNPKDIRILNKNFDE